MIETTSQLTPRYGADGLISAIVQESKTSEILMIAYMNEEALNKTLETPNISWMFT